MIVYLNMTGRRVKADEVIEAIEMAQGHVITGKYEANSKLDLIKLKYARNGKSAVTVKGFQDTRITAHDSGEMSVEHGHAGMGCLRFEPDRFMNRIARVARTDHNMNMLARGQRDGQWEALDTHVGDEIKLLHDKWWKSLDDTEKKDIQERERLSKLTPHQVPARWSQHGDFEFEKLNKEKSENGEALAKALDNNKALLDRIKELELKNANAVVTPKAQPENLRSYEEMTPFELQAILRERGLTIDRKWTKKFMIELLNAPDPKAVLEVER